MKKLILDYSKWRCGGSECTPHEQNILGKGQTALLNGFGYMCCLGQFSLQLNPDLKETDIRHLGEPNEIGKKIPLLTFLRDEEEEEFGYNDTFLSTNAIDINDNPNSTPDEKIIQLKELFATEGYEIEVINHP